MSGGREAGGFIVALGVNSSPKKKTKKRQTGAVEGFGMSVCSQWNSKGIT